MKLGELRELGGRTIAMRKATSRGSSTRGLVWSPRCSRARACCGSAELTFAPPSSEVQLRAELEQASGQDLRGRQPGRTVPGVDPENRAAVEQIVEVHGRLDAHVPQTDTLGDAEVDLMHSIRVLGAIRYQLDRRSPVRPSGQVAPERRRD